MTNVDRTSDGCKVVSAKSKVFQSARFYVNGTARHQIHPDIGRLKGYRAKVDLFEVYGDIEKNLEGIQISKLENLWRRELEITL